MSWPFSPRHIVRLAQLLLALAAAASSLRADVWVVAKSGAADFDEVSDAVAWAAEGDTIWIRDGEYEPIVIDAKSVHLAAIRGSAILIAGIDVIGLEPGQVVSFSGIQAKGPDASCDGALAIRGCAGSVRAKDCEFNPDYYAYYPYNGPRYGPGVLVQDSNDVALVRCELRGGAETREPRLGLVGWSSSISLHGCEVKGGYGTYTHWNATAGIELLDCTLLLSDCDVEGGDGWNPDSCTAGGAGGAGLVAEGTSTLYVQESIIRGGYGGTGYGFICETGPHGADAVVGPDVTVDRLTEPRRSWRCKNISYDGDTVRIAYSGEPGDQVYIARSTQGAFRISPDQGGAQLLARPTTRPPFLGTTSSGWLDIELPIAELEPPEPQESFLLQVHVIDASGQLRWADPGQLTVIDSDLLAPYLEPVYVDIDAPDGGDGSSWELAYNDLQLAFDELYGHWSQVNAFPRDIWIAEGVYVTPTDSYFQLKIPCRIYGGFAGDETELGQRDWRAHPTILSGDVHGDDLPGFQNRDDNAKRVLFAYALDGGPIEIDGLTIRGGGGTTTFDDGGALYLGSVDWFRARNCQFLDNLARYGGGIYLKSKSNAYYDTAYFVDCVFRGNRAVFAGGALRHGIYHTTLTRCSFTDNEGVKHEGGALLGSSGHPAANHYEDCEFVGNRAGGEGGAIYCYGYSTLVGTPCMFITNCTIRDNQARGGGGIHTRYTAPLFDNTILWNNSTSGIVSEDTQLVVMNGSPLPPHYCCIDGWTGAWGGVGNHGLDPLFENGGHLGPGSPCVDAGDNTVVQYSIDLDGNPRFVDDPNVPDTGVGPPPIVDMGAHERQVP